MALLDAFSPLPSDVGPTETEQALNARRVEDLKDMVSQCDIVTINCTLHEGSRNLINAELLQHFKKVRPLSVHLSPLPDLTLTALLRRARGS